MRYMESNSRCLMFLYYETVFLKNSKFIRLYLYIMIDIIKYLTQMNDMRNFIKKDQALNFFVLTV